MPSSDITVSGVWQLLYGGPVVKQRWQQHAVHLGNSGNSADEHRLSMKTYRRHILLYDLKPRTLCRCYIAKVSASISTWQGQNLVYGWDHRLFAFCLESAIFSLLYACLSPTPCSHVYITTLSPLGLHVNHLSSRFQAAALLRKSCFYNHDVSWWKNH